jgi:hypothetical protein
MTSAAASTNNNNGSNEGEEEDRRMRMRSFLYVVRHDLSRISDNLHGLLALNEEYAEWIS